MPRYFFHLYDDLEIRDEEGVTLLDPAAARKLAIESARDVMADNVRGGELCLSHRIEVEDEQGQPVVVVKFRDALTVLP